jgi:NTP pyrophosphatase (non-canonical NTP hydrolase)
MTQLTQAKLKDLNILKLYEHYRVIEKSLPLLTPESQELAQAELEACASLRSEKVDRIYYAMAAHEDALERIKKEGDHHPSQASP